MTVVAHDGGGCGRGGRAVRHLAFLAGLEGRGKLGITDSAREGCSKLVRNGVVKEWGVRS